jgi:hypothetical protein
MEPTLHSAETLPALYRSILGLVEELERADRRAEAARIRSQAMTAYATAWDARQRRRLEQLKQRLQHAIAVQNGTSRTWFRLP